MDSSSSAAAEKRPGFRSMRTLVDKIRETGDSRRGVEAEATEQFGAFWGQWNTDILQYFEQRHGYLAEAYPELYNALIARIAQCHAEGRKAVFADVFGEADGKSMGFDTTVTFSLFSGRKDVSEDRIAVEGDILSRADHITWEQKLKEVEGDVIYIHVDPVDGLRHGATKVCSDQSTSDRYRHVYEFSLLEMKDMFERGYRILVEGGAMTVNTKNVFTDNAESTELFLQYLTEKKIPFLFHAETTVVLIGKPPRQASEKI